MIMHKPALSTFAPALARCAAMAIALATAAGCASTPPPQTSTATASSATPSTAKPLVARVWHGRVPLAKSDEYTNYITENGVKKILGIPKNRGCQLIRRVEGDVAEFYVISYWDNRDDIKKFAGEDIEKTHVLPRDPEFLLEVEPKVRHFDVLVNQWQPPQ